MAATIEHDRFSRRFVNLASERLGASIVHVTDDFFAAAHRMLNPAPAIFVPGKFDKHGKWMDGWESRRKRVEGHDVCDVRLGLPGVVRGVDIDTSHFVGNHPSAASIEACYVPGGDPDGATQWFEILPAVDLEASQHHLHDINCDRPISHVRLHIYPDGGVARLRLYGTPKCDWEQRSADDVIDLAAMVHGGRAIACSNEAFGSSMLSLTLPGRGVDMGDGWETARRRVPGHEWVILELGHPGIVRALEVDTAHYKGNYPDRLSAHAGLVADSPLDAVVTRSMFWSTLMEEQKLQADHIHRFDSELAGLGPVSHVRINNIPDGGISRIRVFGTVSTTSAPRAS